MRPSVAALFLLLFILAPAALPARAEVRRVVVMHTNDLHGQLYAGPDYLTPGNPKPRMGGIAAVAAAIDAERARATAEGAGFLALDAGDFYHGSPEGDFTKGHAVLEVLNLVGYDAMALGNHEFADGVKNVEALVRAARFPILAGNVIRKDAAPDEERWLRGMVITRTAGLRVAIVSVLHEATPRMNRPKDTAGLRFEKAAAALPRLVAEGRVDADIVIALTHIGSAEDLEIAPQLMGCALIVGGHDHVALEPARLVGDTLVVQAGEMGRRVGRVVLEYDTEAKRVVRREATLLNLFADAPRSVTVAAAAEERRRRELDEPLGAAAGEVRRAYSGQSEAGALAVDAIRAAAEAHVAIINETSVRGGFPRGAVTRRDVYACMPFQNNIVRVEISGPELRELLEWAVGRPDGPNVLLSGVRVRFDPTQPRGKRILEARLGDAEIARDRMYKLATTDFYADRTESLSKRERAVLPVTPYEALALQFAAGPVTPPADPIRVVALRAGEKP